MSIRQINLQNALRALYQYELPYLINISHHFELSTIENPYFTIRKYIQFTRYYK